MLAGVSMIETLDGGGVRGDGGAPSPPWGAVSPSLFGSIDPSVGPPAGRQVSSPVPPRPSHETTDVLATPGRSQDGICENAQFDWEGNPPCT
jgi:hypothetical protein